MSRLDLEILPDRVMCMTAMQSTWTSWQVLAGGRLANLIQHSVVGPTNAGRQPNQV